MVRCSLLAMIFDLSERSVPFLGRILRHESHVIGLVFSNDFHSVLDIAGAFKGERFKFIGRHDGLDFAILLLKVAKVTIFVKLNYSVCEEKELLTLLDFGTHYFKPLAGVIDHVILIVAALTHWSWGNAEASSCFLLWTKPENAALL